LTRYFRVKTIL